MAKTAKPQPQPTIVHVKVVTAGPVPMKAVREWVTLILNEEIAFRDDNPSVSDPGVISVTVKRDANIERPRRG